MWKLFRVLMLALSGRFKKAADAWRGNEYVVEATFMNAIESRSQKYKVVKSAVAGMVAIQERDLETLRAKNADIERYTKLQAGAAGLAKKRVEALKAQGVPPEKIAQDPEVLKHQREYADFASSLKEVREHQASLEQSIENSKKAIEGHKASLLEMQRDIENLRKEKHETQADIQISKQLQEIGETLAGVSEDTTSKDLQAVREARQQARANVRITTELSGADAKAVESEYLDFANQSAASSEFAALIGLDQPEPTKEVNTNGSKQLDPARLSET